MTRRSPRPHDRHNRHDARGADSRSWPASAEAMAAAGLIVASLAYATLFFSSSRRYEWLALLLVPEVLVKNWCGGRTWQFACWDRAPIAVGAAAILALAWFWGDRLIALGQRRAEPGSRSVPSWRERFDFERLAMAWTIGLPLVSLVTFGVGVAGWLRSPSLAAGVYLSMTGAIAGASWAMNRRTAYRATQNSDSSDGHVVESSAATAVREADCDGSAWTVTEYVVAAFAVALGSWIVLGGMQPPWEFDVREYHLQAPKEWWQAGRIGFMPHNVYANMPLGAEMFALLATIFWPGEDGWWYGALVGKAVIAATAPITGLILAGIGRRFGSRLAGLSAAAAYLAIPWTGHVAMAGLIDGVLALYVAGAAQVGLAWFTPDAESPTARFRFLPADSWGRGLLLGWIAGAAAACKYPGLALAVAPCGLAAAWASRPGRLDWRAAGAFALAAAVAAGPWHAKNIVVAGNPTYPLFAGWFGGETRSPEKNAQWNAAHRERDAQGRTYSLPLLVDAVARVGWRSEWQSPVLIPLAAVGLWFGRRRRTTWWIAGFAAWIFCVWWLSGHRIDRFWLPAAPLLALLAGGATVAWDSTWSVWRRAVLGVLGTGLAFGGLVLVSPLIGDTRVLAPLATLRSEGRSPLHEQLERFVPAEGIGLLVGDVQPFDLRCRVLYATCFDDSPLEAFVAPATVSERRQAFAAAGVTHVLVDWSEIARYRQPGNYGFPEFVTRELFVELTAEPAVLRRIPADERYGELYEVVKPTSD